MSRYRQLMSEALNQVRAFEDADYLKPRLNPQQIANIKKVFSKKKASDITQSVKDMIKKMDIPTQLAIKQADIPHLSKLVEEEYLPEFNDAMIKTLKKEYEPMRGKTISVTNANKLGALFTRFDSNKNALEKLYGADIPFISTMAMTRLMTKHGYKADKLNKIRKEELDLLEEAELLGEGTGTIKGFRDNKEKSNMVSLAKQHGLKVKDVSGGIELSGNMRKILDMQLAAQGNGLKAEEVAEGRMSDIDAMRKAGATAAEIAKELKLDVKAVKAILGEEVEEEEANDPKEESEKVKLQKELIKKDDEIAALKQKAETEKAKTMKKETEKLVNPETGEPLLQVGIAYKHLKDKMAKESVDEGGAGSGRQPGSSKEVDKVNKSLAKARADKGKKDDADVDAINKALAKARADREVASRKEEVSEMKKDDAYAIGMAQAKKVMNDEPPLQKKTIKKGHEIADKILKKEETIKEYKKMTVTFNSMADMAKASTDLAKQGFTINAKGMVMKVDGKGADLNKYGTDLQNFYKAKVVAEETINEYSSQQIKMAYGILNDPRYKQGNYSGAVKAIEKLARGLSKHPDVANALRRANESITEGKYTRYSDLLIQLGRMKQAKDSQGERNTQKEIDKEKRKLGITESPMMSMNKQSPEYKQGQQAAKQGKKYIDNPHSDAQKKLNWSGGHNAYRALNMQKEMYESLAALKKKADKSGMPYSILKKVFDRGMAAWKGGHRPGASQHQWAYARVNSFVTKSSGTWGGADKDLAAKVKGSK